MTDKIEFALLDNGLDFILRALEYLSDDPSDRDLKYAVLHLSSGIEIIFKERLKREHWTLVFDDVNMAKEESLEDGNFKSVYFHDSLNRLQNICGIDNEDKNKLLIRNLRKRRNKIEHFIVYENSRGIKSTAARVVGFVMDFIGNELLDISEGNTQQINNIRTLLTEFSEFVDQRMEEISDIINNDDNTIITCPKCLQDALVIDEESHCAFCNFTGNGNQIAEEFIHSVLGLTWKHIADGGQWPLHVCPNCDDESLVNLNDEYGELDLICFTCGEQWGLGELDTCSTCGEYYDPGEDGLPICSDCIERIHENND